MSDTPSYESFLLKLARYCAYQERCKLEVARKLDQLAVPDEWHQKLVSYLEQEGYLNEERFARAFVRGKFLHNRWSRNHIKAGLRAKRINESLIKLALSEELDADKYFEMILKLVDKKWPLTKGKTLKERREKLISSMARAGFELDLVLDAVRTVVND